MQSSSARRRRKTFFKSYTSPSLIRNNNNNRKGSVDLACSRPREGSSVSADRLSLPNGDQLKRNSSYSQVTLAQNTKIERSKRSKFKVLLSPRNPYEEFHKLFTEIPKEEFPINDYSCALSRDILLHGRLFVSQNWLCFYSNIFGFETVVKLELRKIKSISRAKTAYMIPNAVLVRTEKKKYLFCSFLMRDAAHKLLSTIWQESTNNKPDSGVDEASANGELDEEESETLEENAGYSETKLPGSAQDLQIPKDPALWKVGQPLRTLSCPNTPLTRHPSVEEKTEANTFHQHGNDHTTRQRSWSDCSIKKRFGRIFRAFYFVIKSLYNYFSAIEWLFKRNKLSADVCLVLSSFFLILLLISTYVLMHRIAKLEDRFNYNLPSDQYLITDEKSNENWNKLFIEQEMKFLQKIQRFNKALNGLISSVENVQSKLKLIKDELES